MDYGDELNDQEEKDYKAELLKQSQIKKDLPKRATRGLRMSALVGKAQEEDDAFYNGLFGDVGEESDQDFNSKNDSVESGRDSFDSDFGKSSDEEGESNIKAEVEEGEAENEVIKEERRQKKKVKFLGIKRTKV